MIVYYNPKKDIIGVGIGALLAYNSDHKKKVVVVKVKKLLETNEWIVVGDFD